ncbi:AB hydrolase superfamily protein [Pleurotus pulmonarius]
MSQLQAPGIWPFTGSPRSSYTLVMFSSSTAKLVDGTIVFYTDSGPPPSSSDYATLVIIHGTGFNGHGFEHIHDIAHERNLRTVAINRREYPGSTPYGDEELDFMTKNPQAHLDSLAQFISLFLVAFIQGNSIPRANEDGTKGGLVALGWSTGCSMLVSMLSNPSAVPPQSRTILEPYLSNIILYDPSRIYGFTPLDRPPTAYTPWLDRDLTTTMEMGLAFKDWVSSYYDPPPPNWDGLIANLDHERKRTPKSSTDSWTQADVHRFCNFEAVARTDTPLNAAIMSAMAGETHRALFDEKLAQTYFPRVKVTVISCRQSVWLCLWVTNRTQTVHDEFVKRGTKVRQTQFIDVEGANHFYHLDDPNGFLDTVVQAIK